MHPSTMPCAPWRQGCALIRRLPCEKLSPMISRVNSSNMTRCTRTRSRSAGTRSSNPQSAKRDRQRSASMTRRLCRAAQGVRAVRGGCLSGRVDEVDRWDADSLLNLGGHPAPK